MAKTTLRAVRIPDALWLTALGIARGRGETLSDVVRDALTRYVKRHGGTIPTDSSSSSSPSA